LLPINGGALPNVAYPQYLSIDSAFFGLAKKPPRFFDYASPKPKHHALASSGGDYAQKHSKDDSPSNLQSSIVVTQCV
jgi:hypothetical protein